MSGYHKKQTGKDKLTALYERLSQDGKRAGESASIENQENICQGGVRSNIWQIALLFWTPI